MSTPPAPGQPAPSDPQLRGEAAEVVEIDGAHLPAFCPNPAMTLWNQHPRVYLDLDVTGSAACPYCGTVYVVKPGTHRAGH